MNTSRMGLLGLLFMGMLTALPASASGLLIADGGFGGELEIVSQDVRVVINNGIAVTHVEQVFRNTENRQVEALYLFPIPKGASVANFSMWIGGKEMIGEVLEKERAREIYNSYKRVRRDPGLLEQNNYQNFEMRIFPIQPRAEQRVQISYYQEMDVDADWITYVYPLSVSPMEGMNSRTEGRFSLNMEVRSEIPVTAMESSSHGDDFVFVESDAHHFRAGLEASGWDLDRDVVLAYQTKRAVTGIDLIGSWPQNEDGYLLMTLTPGEELADRVEGGQDYVFVLDVSGSMANDGKYGLSKGSVSAFVNQLEPQDRLELMTFNLNPNTLFNELESIDEPNRILAQQFLDEGKPRGGTQLRPALELAYRYKDPDRPLNVVILSDGLTEDNEQGTLMDLIRSRPTGARVFCIGVGNDINRPLLNDLAKESGGLAAFISRGENFERQARAFRRKLVRPVATNVELSFEGGGVRDIEPKKIPNLYNGSPLRLYARYSTGGPTKLRMRADIGGVPFERVVEINLPERGASNPEIERMWAWQKVRRLDSELNRGGNRDRILPEIIRLGEAYSIVTPYTSFLVLENDQEYKRWKIERRNARRINRDRKAQADLNRTFEKLRMRVPADLGPSDGRPSDREDRSVTPNQVNPANTPPVNRPQRRNRGVDLNIGGGAMGPFSLALGAGLAFWIRRGRRDEDELV